MPAHAEGVFALTGSYFGSHGDAHQFRYWCPAGERAGSNPASGFGVLTDRVSDPTNP